jgi:cephalosporin hydroxylase
MQDGFLHRYYLNNGGKKLSKWMHYFDIYERHFEKFRGKNPTVLEIGVFGGGSLAMWKGYFGAGCKIIGIDVDPECKAHEAEDIEVFIASQDSPAVVDDIMAKYKSIDIVIDDGSHMQEHMIASFTLLYEKLAADGVYLVEDTHTSYWPDYGGGLRKPGTFIEYCKYKIDELSAFHFRQKLAPTKFTADTNSMTFYDSVVVFEKRPQGWRHSVITRGMDEPR